MLLIYEILIEGIIKFFSFLDCVISIMEKLDNGNSYLRVLSLGYFCVREIRVIGSLEFFIFWFFKKEFV